jgi:ankyrin repeat protein
VLAGPLPSCRPTRHTDFLSSAVAAGDRARVRRCLEEGADPGEANFQGNTPLHCAAECGFAVIVRDLIAAGAPVNAANNAGETPLHRVPLYMHHRLTPPKGHLEVAEILVENGADLNARDEQGNTPLHLAAYFGRVEFARFLVSKGADPTALNARGDTPLSIAERQGARDVVTLLQAFETGDQGVQ